MSIRATIATGLLALALTACGGDNNRGSTPTTPPPPPPPAATIAGNWSGTETVTSVRPDDLCVSNNYEETRLDQAIPVSATFAVDGSNLTITFTHPFGVYTATGTLSGQNFTATTQSVTPADHRLECRKENESRRVTRIAKLDSQTITGSANAGFTSITGTVTTRENTRSVSGANTDPVTTVATLSLTK
jgi:hypothetical protein